jgi:Domain of unknown function (DUF4382)
MKKLFCAIFACLMLALVSCNKDGNSQATLELRLTDGPAMFEEVNIDVQGAEVHVNKDTASSSGWQSLAVTKGIYNVLKLSNGIDTVLGSVQLPLGDISQIRLILGDKNTIKVDGKILPLTISSGDNSGLKLKFEKKLLAGVSYKVLMDFDAAKSVKEVKKGTEYKMKPVIRLITEANNGSIRGEIGTTTCKTIIYAINGTDTLTSTYPSSTNRFVLQGLGAGTYRVAVSAEGTNCSGKTIENVKVEVGKVTELSKIQL